MNTLETLFETKWIQLNRIGHWDFVRRPQAETCVGILAITPANEIILVEQFRIPTQCRVIELPAGIVGDEPEFLNESLADTAARELLEETGYRADQLTPLITSPTSAGLTSEIMHIFLADQLTREHDGGGTANEDIIVHHIPLSDCRNWFQHQITAGKIIDSKIYASLWMAGY